jgi:23S rRNA pseudouridine2605 synthase
MRKPMKLDQYINSQSAYSRRKTLELLNEGRVKVNDKVVSQMTLMVRPGTDVISVNGCVVEAVTAHLYYKYNKPNNLISTLTDPKGRPCLGDVIKNINKTLVPVGRLDRASTGLLLLSNDGAFINKVCHPSFSLAKVYRVTLDRALTKAECTKLLSGFFLEDGPVQFSKITFPSPKAVDVSISEGRNRIVRRAFDHLGHTVKKLKRLAIGPVQLGDLKEAGWVGLTPKEIQGLLA